VLLFEILSE